MTTDLFTEDPFTAPSGISQQERDYNDAFAARLPDILRQRKIAVRGTERERKAIGMRKTVYEGVLITHTRELWKAKRVRHVVWTWDDENINFVNFKESA